MAFGWAYIGCGEIAEKTAKELIESGKGKIVAVWNRTASRAEKFAKRFGGRAYQTAEEAICAEGVQGAYIAVTNDAHAYYTEMCINRGVPVLCEKPFAANADEAQRVFDLAKRRNIYVAEAMWTWHNPVTLQVKRWLDDGAIGKVTGAKGTFAVPMLQLTRKKRLTSPQMVGGALMDIGIYPVRYAYGMFGMPKDIMCEGDVKNGVDYSEKIVMHYDGFDVQLYVSMVRLVGESFTIEGEQGKIRVPIYHKAHSAKLSGQRKDKIRTRDLLYATQFGNVAEEILGGLTESSLVTPQSTLDVLRLLDKCRSQMGTK